MPKNKKDGPEGMHVRGRLGEDAWDMRLLANRAGVHGACLEGCRGHRTTVVAMMPLPGETAG